MRRFSGGRGTRSTADRSHGPAIPNPTGSQFEFVTGVARPLVAMMTSEYHRPTSGNEAIDQFTQRLAGRHVNAGQCFVEQREASS